MVLDGNQLFVQMQIYACTYLLVVLVRWDCDTSSFSIVSSFFRCVGKILATEYCDFHAFTRVTLIVVRIF